VLHPVIQSAGVPMHLRRTNTVVISHNATLSQGSRHMVFWHTNGATRENGR
jgi:hypothetical protein